MSKRGSVYALLMFGLVRIGSSTKFGQRLLAHRAFAYEVGAIYRYLTGSKSLPSHIAEGAHIYRVIDVDDCLIKEQELHQLLSNERLHGSFYRSTDAAFLILDTWFAGTECAQKAERPKRFALCPA